jgi:multiple sugar transport system permease protein
MLPTSLPKWVGAQNYKLLLAHPDFQRAVVNTLLYIAGMLPFSVIIPLALAIATEKLPNRAKNFYRAIFFLPMVMPPVTVSVVWRWLFHPANGIVNQVLVGAGILESGVNFLGNETWAMFSIILIAGWKMIGFSTLMFSAALTGIDRSYYYVYGMKNFNVGMSAASAILFLLLFGALALLMTRLHRKIAFYDN